MQRLDLAKRGEPKLAAHWLKHRPPIDPAIVFRDSRSPSRGDHGSALLPLRDIPLPSGREEAGSGCSPRCRMTMAKTLSFARHPTVNLTIRDQLPSDERVEAKTDRDPADPTDPT